MSVNANKPVDLKIVFDPFGEFEGFGENISAKSEVLIAVFLRI